METCKDDDDIHICGKCRLEFHSLNTFVQHKNSCPAAKQRRRDHAVSSNVAQPCIADSAASDAAIEAVASCSSTVETVVESSASPPIVSTSIAPDVLVGGEMQIHLDTSGEQMAEETVETAQELEGIDEDDSEVDRGNAILIDGQMHLTKQEVVFDAEPNRANSHGVQVRWILIKPGFTFE